MISRITGTIVERSPGAVVVDVAGISYLIHVSNHTFTSLKKDGVVTLFTHLAVRENAMDLYGFDSPSERALFELLIGVPGIGPKSALAILSLATPDILRTSIARGDTTYLTKVGGIGKKTAEKVVLELRDKIGKDTGGPDLGEETDAAEALKSLGYSLAEAREALKKVSDKTTGTSERVKEALKLLSSRK